jgi:hypothetical protein
MGRCRIATTAPPSRPPLAVSGSCGTLPSLAEPRWARSRRATGHDGPGQVRSGCDGPGHIASGGATSARPGSGRTAAVPHRRCAAPPLCRTAAVSHRRRAAPRQVGSGQIGSGQVGSGESGRSSRVWCGLSYSGAHPHENRPAPGRVESAEADWSARVRSAGVWSGWGSGSGRGGVLGGWLGAWRGLVGSSSFQPSGGNSVSVHFPAMITRSCPGWSPHAGEAGHARRRSCPPRRRPCQAGSARRGRSAGRRRPGTGDSPARRPARSRSPAPV